MCGWVNLIFYGKDQFGGVRFFFVDVVCGPCFCRVKAVFWWYTGAFAGEVLVIATDLFTKGA